MPWGGFNFQTAHFFPFQIDMREKKNVDICKFSSIYLIKSEGESFFKSITTLIISGDDKEKTCIAFLMKKKFASKLFSKLIFITCSDYASSTPFNMPPSLPLNHPILIDSSGIYAKNTFFVSSSLGRENIQFLPCREHRAMICFFIFIIIINSLHWRRQVNFFYARDVHKHDFFRT